MRPTVFLSILLCTLFLFSFCLRENSTNNQTDLTEYPARGTTNFIIAFYNVENLFDTQDDPAIDDSEFLPGGKNDWTHEKYKAKSDNIARVISELNDGNGADLVGLSEVENEGVIKDLINHPQLKKMDYGIVHHESPDMRGIDVAMIYKKKSFRVIGTKALTVDISQFESRPTRDILLITGITSTKDTLYIFLNHWPSRRGGTQESQARREAAAKVLRKAADSILLKSPYAKMVLMGDFNDNPSDASVSKILGATKTPDMTVNNSLYDPANNFNWKAGEGSEFYKGDWSRFIQIILSTSLIKNELDDQNNFHDIYLFKPPWLLTEEPAYQQMIPYRTFEAQKPIGFSDHLPVYVKLKL
ncbi:MAG: endonuclease/exonuclease/phosphatase family protein [Chitinophagaceae bacterium]|nr:endonuclease/exonuclease/phosphatase family protein [Chitinophagaceae bacterium]